MNEHNNVVKVEEEPVFPTKDMRDLIDLTITEMVLKKYGKIWSKRYRTNENVHIFHHAGQVEIDHSYLETIRHDVIEKIIKYQNNGRAFKLRCVVKRAIKYEAS